MNILKSSFLILSFLISSVLIAQPQGGGQQGPPPIPNAKQIKKTVASLASEISLTEEQEASVLEVYIKHFEIVKAKTESAERPKREEMEALDIALQNEVKALLTEEQIVKYNAYLKKQEANRPKR